MSLYVYTDNVQLRNMMRDQIRRLTDSGFDVPMLGEQVMLNATLHTFALGIKIAAVDVNNMPVPCLLIPRSSISASPFRLANSIGLIDAGYRGEVKAKVDVTNSGSLLVENGTRFFQICQHNFLPWNQVIFVQLENDLPAAPDNRGAGGFGSTG